MWYALALLLIATTYAQRSPATCFQDCANENAPGGAFTCPGLDIPCYCSLDNGQFLPNFVRCLQATCPEVYSVGSSWLNGSACPPRTNAPTASPQPAPTTRRTTATVEPTPIVRTTPITIEPSSNVPTTRRATATIEPTPIVRTTPTTVELTPNVEPTTPTARLPPTTGTGTITVTTTHSVTETSTITLSSTITTYSIIISDITGNAGGANATSTHQRGCVTETATVPSDSSTLGTSTWSLCVTLGFASIFVLY